MTLQDPKSASVPLDVHKFGAVIAVSPEMLADHFSLEEWRRRAEEEAHRFNALPPEEQARVRVESEVAAATRREAYEAERCSACGCHPDEHGSD